VFEAKFEPNFKPIFARVFMALMEEKNNDQGLKHQDDWGRGIVGPDISGRADYQKRSLSQTRLLAPAHRDAR
jgi:hypothetical protein